MISAAFLALTLSGATAASAQTTGPCAPGPADGAAYPPARVCAVTADRTQTTPGGRITLTGQCPAGTTSVRFTLNPGSVDLGSATPNANGDYSRAVTIPASAKPGSYTIVAACQGTQGANVTRSVAITVVAAAGTPALPRTGSSTNLPLVLSAVALIAVGGFGVLASRRRRA
ncbi:MAG TPA: LPXTG cell wall anchor domain-containing protein [Acidimicrobiales bacterium]|nr:LPXTG cell wall anchor domain-containing protein [Acidimicrobiales bacterium]